MGENGTKTINGKEVAAWAVRGLAAAWWLARKLP